MALLLELLDQKCIEIECVAEMCGTCISSCLLSLTSVLVRQAALLLTQRCMSSPFARTQILSKLMLAVQQAKPVGPLFEQDKNRLAEYAQAIEACLVDDEQKKIFGAQIDSFAELVSSVNSQGDPSKWMLLKTLLAGVVNVDASIDKLLQCGVFLRTLGRWTIDTNVDSDDAIATYCRVVLLLAQRSREFVSGFVCREAMNSEKMTFLFLPEICQQKGLFPVSLPLVDSFIELVLSEPACATEFAQRLVEAVAALRNQETMAMAVKKIESLRQRHVEVFSAAFWMMGTIERVVKQLQENVLCFVPLCRLVSMFVDTLPERFKSGLARYCMASYRFYTGCTPLPEEGAVGAIDADLGAILSACCQGEWSKNARLLFEVLTTDPLPGEPSQTVVFPRGVLDRAVQRVLKEGLAALGACDENSSERRVLAGMGVAYVAMCARDVPELPALVSNVRALLGLDTAGTLPSICLQKTTRVVLLSVDAPAYSDAAADLLAACYAKSDLSACRDELAPGVDRAVETARGYSDDAAIVQKVRILCHSPVLAELFAPHLALLDTVSARAGERGARDMQEIRRLCSPFVKSFDGGDGGDVDGQKDGMM